MRSRFARRAALVFAVLALIGGGAAIVAAATPSADFVLSANPSSATVLQGTPAHYSVHATGTNGFKSPVTLAVSGVPTGAAATLTNNPNSLSADSALTVSTNATTGTGDYSLTVTGTSGKLKHTVQVVLTVTKPTFTMVTSPAAATVIAGSPATYAVSLTRTNLAAVIAFTVSGLPANATAVFSPNSTTGNATSLLITTSSTTPAGSYPISIKGAAGSVTASVSANLTVQKPPTPKLTLAISPSTFNAPAGTNATYTVTLTRTNLPAAIALAVTGLPANTTAAFTPSPATGDSTTLTVSTANNTPLGNYTLTVAGAAGSVTANATTRLTVSAAQHKNFGIAGTLDRLLSPGVTGYLNLSLTNPNNQPLSVTSLVVTITGTSKAACTLSGNFTTLQFSGAYPLVLPANSTRTLSQLGVAQANWPRITMVDLPTNQDSCKNVSLSLGYAGNGNGQ